MSKNEEKMKTRSLSNKDSFYRLKSENNLPTYFLPEHKNLSTKLSGFEITNLKSQTDFLNPKSSLFRIKTESPLEILHEIRKEKKQFKIDFFLKTSPYQCYGQ